MLWVGIRVSKHRAEYEGSNIRYDYASNMKRDLKVLKCALHYRVPKGSHVDDTSYLQEKGSVANEHPPAEVSPTNVQEVRREHILNWLQVCIFSRQALIMMILGKGA